VIAHIQRKIQKVIKHITIIITFRNTVFLKRNSEFPSLTYILDNRVSQVKNSLKESVALKRNDGSDGIYICTDITVKNFNL